MAKAAQKKAPEKDVHPIIATFRVAYKKALERALVSKAHTDTEGWRKLYAEHAEEVIRRRHLLANDLHELADMMECGELDEDDEKSIADIKKSAAGMREAEQHWQRQTVGPVKAPVDECYTLLQNVLEEARRAQLAAPLHNPLLVDTVHEQIDRVPKVSWGAETGEIGIDGEEVDGKTGEVLLGA